MAERNSRDASPSQSTVEEGLSFRRRIEILFQTSRAIFVAQHLFFSNINTYVRLYLNYGDKADYLRQPFTDAWRSRFSNLQVIASDMASSLRAQGIPLIMMTVPSRAEVGLVNNRNRPADVDPFAFGREVHSIASQAGANYLGLTRAFANAHDGDRYFYPVDIHLNGEGQVVISKALVRACLSLDATNIGCSPAH